MKTLTDQVALETPSNRPWWLRAVGLPALTILLAVAITGLIGCGGSTRETTTTTAETVSLSADSVTRANVEAAAELTSTITLSWDAQNNCVEFAPRNTTLSVGDRVNFNTSIDNGVTVKLPAGLFSGVDTTITVSRGANHASPMARMLGAYELASVPAACTSTAGGGVPSITVSEGVSKPNP